MYSARLAKTVFTDPGCSSGFSREGTCARATRSAERVRREARGPTSSSMSPRCGQDPCACPTPGRYRNEQKHRSGAYVKASGLTNLAVGTRRFHGSEDRGALSSESWPSDGRTEGINE